MAVEDHADAPGLERRPEAVPLVGERVEGVAAVQAKREGGLVVDRDAVGGARPSERRRGPVALHRVDQPRGGVEAQHEDRADPELEAQPVAVGRGRAAGRDDLAPQLEAAGAVEVVVAGDRVEAVPQAAPVAPPRVQHPAPARVGRAGVRRVAHEHHRVRRARGRQRERVALRRPLRVAGGDEPGGPGRPRERVGPAHPEGAGDPSHQTGHGFSIMSPTSSRSADR